MKLLGLFLCKCVAHFLGVILNYGSAITVYVLIGQNQLYFLVNSNHVSIFQKSKSNAQHRAIRKLLLYSRADRGDFR
jgi:hypothetical protein